MSEMVEQFRAYRAKMNEKILAADNKVIKRIYNLDTNTYMDGALSSKVKEMLGLATSMVLRCDDCIKYHWKMSPVRGNHGRVVRNILCCQSGGRNHRDPSYPAGFGILGRVAGNGRE